MHFTLIELPYTDEIAKNYQKLQDLPGFVLLESIDKTRGRYDILSAMPYHKIKLVREQGDIEKTFTDLQKAITHVDYGLDLPFQGGAIGFFSYDLACELANIEISPQNDLASVPLLLCGLYDWAIITDHQLRKITLFAGNTQADTPAIIDKVLTKWHSPMGDNLDCKITSPFSPLISKIEYEQAFHAIHQDLQRGRCYQVNYTQPFVAGYEGSLWAIYQRIREVNPVPYAAFMHTEYGGIISFSPERFVKLENRFLLTSPIKGSEKRVHDPELDNLLCQKLLSSEKNRAENVMIVDLLRNDFGQIAKTGSVIVDGLCQVESYSEVHHLVSHIRAQCRDEISAIQAFKACFPGGSITGAPKLESMKVIAEHEKYARGIYCGSIGYFSKHGQSDSNIAIRTITATKNFLHLYAGGGIVIDSDCEEEYQECFIKIAAILKGLYES